jgi:hypothetical protein
MSALGFDGKASPFDLQHIALAYLPTFSTAFRRSRHRSIRRLAFRLSSVCLLIFAPVTPLYLKPIFVAYFRSPTLETADENYFALAQLWVPLTSVDKRFL